MLFILISHSFGHFILFLHTKRNLHLYPSGKTRLTQGRKKEFHTREIQHQRWLDDFVRQQNAVRIRSKSHDHLLLRKVGR